MPALSHELIIRPRLPEYLSYSSQKFQPISTSHPLLRLVCPPKRAYVSVLIARLRLPHPPPPTDERVDAISYSFQTNRMSRTIRRYVDNRCTEISCPSYIFENILADVFFLFYMLIILRNVWHTYLVTRSNGIEEAFRGILKYLYDLVGGLSIYGFVGYLGINVISSLISTSLVHWDVELDIDPTNVLCNLISIFLAFHGISIRMILSH